MSKHIDVYLEVGARRTFAGALDWPGWCRSGRDPDAALQALFEYGPRYARVLSRARLGFSAPSDSKALVVVERLEGGAGTDFGAPEAQPEADHEAMDGEALRRAQAILRACWRAFDAAAEAATGKELRKGPRGGGRELDAIIEHVLGADEGYLSRIGGKLKRTAGADPKAQLEASRATILDSLAAAARGEVAPVGPRGGKRWPPRYYVRRAAWHVLDHAWELENRVL
jgi:hypothetical protein